MLKSGQNDKKRKQALELLKECPETIVFLGHF